MDRDHHARTEDLWACLEEALPGAERCAVETHGARQPDLQVRGEGDRRLLVELKEVRAPRVAEVEGQLARSVLQLTAHDTQPGALPIAVVWLPRFGPRLEKAVRAFMTGCAPHVGWGLMDERGQAVLEIPPLGLSWRRGPSHADREALGFERRDRQLFTDLNRWMLKVLLLRDAPENQWGGPRARARHPTELAAVADVSVSKAHQFAAAFHEEGYLRKTSEGLRLVRIPALLEAWLQDERGGSPKRAAVRSLLPGESALRRGGPGRPDLPLPRQAWSAVALGGLSAARALGVSHVSTQQLPLVHAEDSIASVMRAWGLEPAEPHEAQMVLSEPLYPRSVFRGRVVREEDPPLVDLWQIALDSVTLAARGREQADYIVQRVLQLQEDA